MSELKPDLIAVSTAPIEFIPTFRHLPSRPDEYERYVQRRWSLMLAKWNFSKQIELNMSFDDFVADQLAPQQNSPERLHPCQQLVKRTGRPHGEDELLDRLRRLDRAVDELQPRRAAAQFLAKIFRHRQVDDRFQA